MNLDHTGETSLWRKLYRITSSENLELLAPQELFTDDEERF